MNLAISEELFKFFASDPVGPMLNLRHVVNQGTSPISSDLNALLARIPQEVVTDVRADKDFLWFAGQTTDIDREARTWIAERWLSSEISRRRLQLLRDEAHIRRPTPYNISALADLEVDDEHLVRLSEFNYDGSRLLRNGFAFSTLLTQCSPNSNYWLQEGLFSTRLAANAKVRLDPFLFAREEEFPAMLYRMTMYGRHLDWDRIGRLREPEHGRWLSRWRETVTEYCWSPRGTEVIFVCEEIPKPGQVDLRACRYLHAVYDSESCVITHLDGALRLYSQEQIEIRETQHVRVMGKAGLRAKVFRIDTAMSREHLSLIAQTFFVWNEDVQKYFFSELAVH